ncbi:MAG: hypothetical protein AAGE65_11020 [Planctomycetota bacterium]
MKMRERMGRSLAALACVAGLWGCAATPTPGPIVPPLLRSTATADPGASDPGIAMAGDTAGFTDASTAPEGALAVAFVTLVDLPLDVSLEPAWSVVDEDVFPAITSGVWRSNGLRIGLLPKRRLTEFLHALPANWGNRRQRIWGGDEPAVLVRSRPIRAAFFADLTVPPFAPQRETFQGHTTALLMKLRPLPGGFTRVTITPQHHRPRQTIRMRTAQEKLLDGRVFEELSVTVAVPEEGHEARYLVLGLARDPRTLPVDQRDLPRPGETDEPRFETPEPAEDGGSEVAADGGLDVVLQSEGGLPDPPDPEPENFGEVVDRRVEPLPLNLGRALMTTGMRGGEAQVLMILEIRGLRQ